MKKSFVIYKVTCKVNGKIYIGKTNNFEKRKREHILDKNVNIPFHKALRKYGIENFDWEIIDTASSDGELIQKEIYWIKELNTCIKFPNSNGYNITLGGEGGFAWNSRKIVQFSLNGEYIQEFESSEQAQLFLHKNGTSVKGCANGRYKQGYGYLWKWYDEWDGNNIEPYKKPISNKRKRVVQLDEKGNFIGIYDSVLSASEITKIRRTAISGCLIGNYKTAGGYIWLYEKDYIDGNDYSLKPKCIKGGIYQLDDYKNVINWFPNCSDACRNLGFDVKVHKQIQKATGTGNKCRGFYWCRQNDLIIQQGNTEITC